MKRGSMSDVQVYNNHFDYAQQKVTISQPKLHLQHKVSQMQKRKEGMALYMKRVLETG